MNDLPSDWSEQLQRVYPKRSGPSGWKGMKLMLALRRALFDSTWEQIIDGCKNYQKYCQAGGIEGSAFVQAPTRYIEDGSYLETFTHQAAEDPKVTERKRNEEERWRQAREAGERLVCPIVPHSQECLAAFETRIMLSRRDQRDDGRSSSAGNPSSAVSNMEALGSQVASLANRMRIAK